jgi:hypothetical protein
MADNLTTQSATPATIPASTVIATDDAGAAGHVQVVKLAVSTDGSAIPLTANNTDGLLVNLGSNNDVTVTSISAGDNNIGNVDVVTLPALPAGTNNIGDVDILSIAAGDNNIGNVDIVTMPAVTNAGTFAVQESGAALTALQLIDDTVYTDGTGTPSKAIGIAGTDGTNPQIVKTDASGELQVDVLSMPTTTVTGTVAVTQSGTWDEVGINDSGNSITVDGTVTANLAAGTNNIGDVDILSIAAGDNNIGNVDLASAIPAGANKIGGVDLDSDATPGSAVPATAQYIAGTDGTNARGLKTDSSGELQIDVLSSALPSGAATAANQSTANTALSAIQTAVETLDNTVSGSEIQVDVVGALPAGTNNIGDVDIASITAGDNTIGRVKITDGTDMALVDGSGNLMVNVAAGAGTQYTEDAAAAANPVGGALIMVRDDALSGQTSDDGDNIAARGTDKGELYVKHVDAIPAAQSGTWNITNVSGTVSLPTGASTLAEQQSQTTHLATIAGDTTDIETAVELIDDTVATLGTTTYSEATTKGLIIGAVRRDADTTLVDTTNEVGPVQMNAAGQLKVEVFSGETLPVSLTSTTVTGTVAVTQSGTWDEVGINDSGNSITVDNGGTFAVQVDGSALTALQKIDDPVLVDDAGFTPATSSVMMAGFEADEASIDSVDEGDAGAARMTLDRKQIVTVQGHTAGGLSTFMASGSDGSSILVATAQAIKASAGQMYGYYAYNPEAAVTFVHFYNTAAASVTVGTTNPLFTIAIPAGAAANLSIAQGITFSNAGWSCAATTTAGGNTAPATGVSLVVWYM